jgi:hypothetical protein
MQMPLCVLAALGLVACASSPPSRDERAVTEAAVPAGDVPPAVAPGTAVSADLVQLDVDSALSLLEQNADERDAWLASNVSVGLDEELLRYRASYSIDSGDFLEAGDTASAGAVSPTTFGGQRLGQNVSLQLPVLEGAPLSLGFATESSGRWLVSGFEQSQQEQANLEWSPGFATVNVQWAGAGEAADPSLALDCDVRSTIRLPTHQRADHSQALRISGRECTVAAGGTPYAGTAAQTWGLGYVWSRPERESEAVLSVIDPAWRDGIDWPAYQDLEPSYQFALSQARDFGALSAKALVSVRQATILEAPDSPESTDTFNRITDTYWAANASLTWSLPAASLSASWAKGVDPLWFTPEVGERSDRFGLELDLSRWMQGLLPEVSPELGMSWNWAEDYLPGERIGGSNSLQLNLGWMF